MKKDRDVEVSEKDAAMKALKQLIFNAVIFLALMAATFWFIFKDQDMNEVIDVTTKASPIFLILGLLCMVGYFSMEAWNVSTLLKSFGEKISFLQAFKFTLIGFFFCAVTPGASGGQPLEIYYMTKEGISGANATITILIQTCGIQFAVTTLGILCAIIGNGFISGPVLWLFIIGLLINGVALIILLLSVFKTGGLRKFFTAILRFMNKRGVHQAESWEKSLNEGLDQYAESSKYIKSHKKEFRVAMAKSFVQISLFYLIPFCVYKAFGLSGHNIFTLFTMQSILFVATSGLPIPGAIGASETVFLSLYGAVFGETLLSSAMLLNRGINFYWFVIVSMLVVFANMIMKGKVSPSSKDKKKVKAKASAKTK